MALMLIANVPLVGLPWRRILVPFGTLGITAAGRDAERNVVPMPSLLLEGFKASPAQRAGAPRLSSTPALSFC